METANEFYTTQLQAGLGLVEETKRLLALYEAGMTVTQLNDAALASGLFPMVSARRLRNIIAECFSPRYMKSGVAIYLKELTTALTTTTFNQLLLIHTAIANRILRDFIGEIFWQRYTAGREFLSIEDARDFVTHAVREGKTQKPWSDSTIKRISSYLLGCCADYNLLSSGRSSKRTIIPVRIHPETSLYLAYWLHFAGYGDNALVNREEWKLFGMEPYDVREELKKLTKSGSLIVQAAGDVTRISWPLKSMEEVIDVITQG
ncbi:MAG: BrxA family protein [Pseudomonadota bacterium]